MGNGLDVEHLGEAEMGFAVTDELIEVVRVFDKYFTLGGGVGIVAEEVCEHIADIVGEIVNDIKVWVFLFDFFEDVPVGDVEICDDIQRDVYA